jgi:hypothetical protein
MSPTYNGYISNCSFTLGTVTGGAKGYWTLTGGIAGLMVGSNTKIERCYVTGTVDASGTQSGWTYAGGIVAYNYYGALVSQSYFTGTLRNNSGKPDYTGGIAGYNSKETGSSSTIQDCWSAGTVQGYTNAGGIVGQNQVNAVVQRCYSRAAVSVVNITYIPPDLPPELIVEPGDSDPMRSGAGGIAGFNANILTASITACVALNTSVTAGSGNDIHRVIGLGAHPGTNNHARGSLTPTTGGTLISKNTNDGEDCNETPDQAFYTSLGWTFGSIWKMGFDGYPILSWQ